MKKVFIAAMFMVTLASCDLYYVDPRVDNRSRVVGNYSVEEHSSTYDSYHYYSVYVTKTGGRYSNQIYLNNFYDANISAYAYLNGNSITIPFQVVDGYEVEGTGNVYGSDLNLNFRVRDTYNNYAPDFGNVYATREY